MAELPLYAEADISTDILGTQRGYQFLLSGWPRNFFTAFTFSGSGFKHWLFVFFDGMSHEFYFWLSGHKFGLVQLQVCFSCSLEKPGQAVVMVLLSLHITLQIHHLAKTLLVEVHLTNRGACIPIRLASGLLQIVFSSIRGPEYGFHATFLVKTDQVKAV